MPSHGPGGSESIAGRQLEAAEVGARLDDEKRNGEEERDSTESPSDRFHEDYLVKKMPREPEICIRLI